MARLITNGFELNSTLNGVEWSNNTAGVAISNSVTRSGIFAGRITGMGSGADRGFRYSFSTSNQSGPYYVRTYFRYTTLPSADNTVFCLQSIDNSIKASIKCASDGTLELYDEDGQIGSASSALTANKWYRLEIQFDKTAAAGSHVVRARIDGVEFAGSATRSLSDGIGQYSVGANLALEAQTTGDFSFDDCAVNNSSGSFQNSFPGAGATILLRPDAAGDNNALESGSATNFQSLDETPPNDGTDSISIGTNAVDDIDDYNLSAPTLMNAGDVVNVVHVGARFKGVASSNNDSFVLRIKASSGGTVEETANLTPTSTAYGSNSVADPRNFSLTLYDLPGASTTAWTKADLEAAQIGMRKSADSTNGVDITALWLAVDYTPTILARNLTTSGNATDASSSNTATIVPSPDCLVLAFVYNVQNDPATPSMTGNSLTWVVEDSAVDLSDDRRLTVLRALGPSTSSGAATIDFGGQSQTGVIWSIVEFEGVDTSGTNGSGAVVQSVGGFNAVNDTGLSITLAAFGNSKNATVGGFNVPINTASILVPGTGFAYLGQRNQGNPNLFGMSQFNGDNDTSVDESSGVTSTAHVGIAAEIRAAGTLGGEEAAVVGIFQTTNKFWGF